MIACAYCGVHLPRDEALPGRGGVFCGDAHRAAFEKEQPRSHERTRRRPRATARPGSGVAIERRILVRCLRAGAADGGVPPRSSTSRGSAHRRDSRHPVAIGLALRASRRERQEASADAAAEIAETTFERIYRAFIAARAAIGVALIVTLALPACSACGRRSASSP